MEINNLKANLWQQNEQNQTDQEAASAKEYQMLKEIVTLKTKISYSYSPNDNEHQKGDIELVDGVLEFTLES